MAARFFYVLFALFSAVPSLADMRDTTYVLDPLIVSATPSETERRNLPQTVTVVDGEEMRLRGATDVIEGLAATVPGLSVTQRGVVGFGLGSSSSGKVRIRGIGGLPNSQVLFMVDGRPDFVGLFSHPVPDAYDLNQVERVEIVRGPASAVYGTNAMGGVVNIITRRMRTPGHQASLNLMGGPWNTGDASATLFGKLSNGIDYRLSAGVTTTDGHADSTDFQRYSTSGLVGWTGGPWDVSLRASRSPFEGSSPGEEPAFDIVRNSASLTAGYARGILRGKSIVHANWGHHEFAGSGWSSDDHTLGWNTHASVDVPGGGSATVAFDVKTYGGDATSGGIYLGSPSVTEYAPSVAIRLPVGDVASVTTSLWAQHHSQYGWFLAPQGGIAVTPISALTVRANVSRGFRSPDLRAMYLFPPIPVDSKTYADLDPERTLSYEGGVTVRPSEWLVTDLTVFRTEGKDILLAMPFRNGGQFTRTGVESESKFSLSRVRGRVFMSYLDSGSEKGATSKYTLGGSITTRIEQVSITLDGRRVMDSFDDEMVNGKYVVLPDYTLLNLAVSRPVWKGIRARIMLRNLLDSDYSTEFESWTANGQSREVYYAMPGFHVLIGISADIGIR